MAHETEKETTTRQLAELMELVHNSASGGRVMTPELRTKVQDACYDIVSGMVSTVSEESRRF